MKHYRMSTKLSITFAVFLISLVGILSVSFYSYNRNSIYKESISNLKQVSSTALLQLDSRLTAMEQVAVDSLTDKNLMIYLNTVRSNIGDVKEAEDGIKRILTRAYKNKTDIRRVTVFLENGFYISTGKTNAETADVIKKLEFLKANYNLSGMNNRCFIKSHLDDWDKDSHVLIVSEIKPIKNNNMDIIGYIEVQQNIMYIDKACKLMLNDHALNILIFMDSDDKLLYASNPMKQEFITEVKNFTREYRKVRESNSAVYITESSNYYPCRMVLVAEKSILFKSMNEILRGIILAAFVLIGFTFAYILFVTKRIMRPINLFIKRMEHTDIENFSLKSNDVILDVETEILTKAFEKMTFRLKESLNTQKKLQDLNTKTIFNILQSEISPHFLYNSLGGIANMCENGENEAASDACYSLTEILRYASNYAVSEVSIKDEIDNLNSYMKIMKSRYCERLNFTIHTEVNSYPLILPKFTFQPLVENAIRYSLIEKEQIEIRVITQLIKNTLEIRVEDNGFEISEDMKSRIKEKLERFINDDENIYEEIKFGGMGLGGTLIRLSIYFKNRFSYELTGNINGGTTIILKIQTNL